MQPSGVGFSLPRWGNVLAPQWMGLTPLMRDVADLEADLAVPISIAAGVTLDGTTALVLPIDDDADVLCRELQWIFIGPNPGVVLSDLRFRLHDWDGSLITLEFCDMMDLVGTVGPPLYLQKGTQIIIDVMNVGVATITGQLIFKCVKRLPCLNPDPIVQPFTPMYRRYSTAPAGYHDEPYRLYYEITVPAGPPVLQLPLPNEKDGSFVWRGISGNGAALSTVIRLYDPGNVPLFDTRVPYAPATSRRPGAAAVIWPEIEIPLGGVIYGDFALAPTVVGTQTVKLCLRGVKRIKDAC
jgi:hypothetical protein